jgi:chromate reductase, NAD(P)H dehydrogenase (quinone)
MRILGISGSLRRGSYNRRLLLAAAATLPPEAAFAEFDRLGELPPFNEDREFFAPEPVEALRAAVRDADAVIIATPEYNHSLPGVLKNALDWLSRPTVAEGAMKDKPVLVVGSSTGLFGAVWAQADTRKVLGALSAHVLDDELPVGLADDAFELDGSLRDPELASRLEQIVENLVREVGSPIEQSA